MFGGDKRNLVIAVAAIFVILVAWQFLMPVLFPPEERPQRVAEQAAPGTVPADQVTVEGVPSEPSAEVTVPPTAATQASVDSPRIRIDAPRLHGSISLVGGRIDSVTLRDYREEANPESPEIVLLSPRDADAPYFVDFGWATSDEGVAVPRPDTLWTADRSVLTTGNPVTLRWDNGEGLVFSRTIAVDEDYVFTVTQSIQNTSDKTVALSPFSGIARFSGATHSTLPFKPMFIFQEGALGIFGEDYHEADYEDMQDAFFASERASNEIDEYTYDATQGWLGLTDKFWLVALIPDQQTPFRGSFEYIPVDGGKTDSFQAIYRAAPIEVSRQSPVSLTTHVFAGAKEISLLDEYEESLGADRFDVAVDFGPTWFISKPMFYVIDFFNRATGNFGVAILLLTICVRILLYPLANKAYASMSRMRKLQPEMIRLRERFKEDKPRMNTELMKLYREQKANPVAGCFPLLAQIPVFFALYYMLFTTIEMRHAPFFGWIQDLSAPDPMTFITGFGALDWDAPEFLLIGLWPIAFGATMWLQMKLNPQPMEPIQQKILMALPIVFLFLFARFPAGLVVYWTWNNVLSIAQQWLIMRRMGITRASLAADAAKIKKIKEAAEKGTLLKPSRSRRKSPSRAKESGEASGTQRKKTTARKASTGTKSGKDAGAKTSTKTGAKTGKKKRTKSEADGADTTSRSRTASAASPKSTTRKRAAKPKSKAAANNNETKPAKRRTAPRRKPATRRKPGAKRKPAPQAAAPQGLLDRLKAGVGLSKPEPAVEPPKNEPPKKSRKQRKAERAERTDTATPDDKNNADDADTSGNTPAENNEWASQSQAKPRQTRPKKRARRR
jgi:YidC/Oxa1 family membrane protein insertase